MSLPDEGPPRELSQCYWFYPFPTPGTAPSGAAVTFLACSNLAPQLGKDECRWQWCYLLYPEIDCYSKQYEEKYIFSTEKGMIHVVVRDWK